ncbi:MAG: hypothetical protein AABY46_07670, partial [Nitrospirota bacterium]
MEQGTKDLLAGLGLAVAGGAIVYGVVRWQEGPGAFSAFTLIKQAEPKKVKHGTVNVGASWDWDSDPEAYEAAKWLQEKGYTLPKHLGEIFKMLKNAVARAEANPDNFIELQIIPKFKTIVASPGSPGSSGRAKGTGGHSGKVYYDAKVKEPHKSWKVLDFEFGKKKGTTQKGASDYAKAA